MQDRHDLDKDRSMRFLSRLQAAHPEARGGTIWEDYADTLRPLPNRVWARRDAPEAHASAKAAGVVVPDACDRHDGQQTSAWFTVLAVGDGVTSVKPGDRVRAISYIGAPLGGILGDDIFELWTDIPYVDERTHETEARRNPDGSVTFWQRPMSDVERRSGGDIDAVLTDE